MFLISARMCHPSPRTTVSINVSSTFFVDVEIISTVSPIIFEVKNESFYRYLISEQSHFMRFNVIIYRITGALHFIGGPHYCTPQDSVRNTILRLNMTIASCATNRKGTLIKEM